MSRTPLRRMLEEVASSKGINMQMTPQQLSESGTPLNEYIQDRMDHLGPVFRQKHPIVLTGQNETLSLSYLWGMVELVGHAPKWAKWTFHPTETLVAENEYRTLIVHAETGRYLGHRCDGLDCTLIDKMLFRLLPAKLREKEEGRIGEYYVDFSLNPKNLDHITKLLKGLF